MSWSIGYDPKWKRDIGYGVPATCDHPGCGAAIDRGLAHVCRNEEPYGGEDGCGLYFCKAHLTLSGCARCAAMEPPFTPTPDAAEWVDHKLSDPSWAEWRRQNPQAVVAMMANAAPRGGVRAPAEPEFPGAEDAYVPPAEEGAPEEGAYTPPEQSDAPVPPDPDEPGNPNP